MKRSKIRPVSRKRAAQQRVYAQLRRQFLAAHPYCGSPWSSICSGRADQVHHMAGRDGDRLLDQERWMALCGPCHAFATTHPADAITAGVSLPRVGVAS